MAGSERKPPGFVAREDTKREYVAAAAKSPVPSQEASVELPYAPMLNVNDPGAASEAREDMKRLASEMLREAAKANLAGSEQRSEDREAPPWSESSGHIGQHVGPYRLVRRLGQGGMGVVYEAVHEEIGQRVAIKLLATDLAQEPKYRQRFLREAKAGSKVRHPGLVQIFNYGLLKNSTPFIQMEYLEGRLLRAYMVRQPDFRLPLEAALRLGRQIADALAAAHAGGIVHRDLKPENIMLVAEPEAPGGERTRVLDFGIAKFLAAPEMNSAASGVQPLKPVGTPTYMSPEQCRGDASLDGKSDVYSLGVILYEMLCGRPPFTSDAGSSMGVVYQHVFTDPRPPRQLCQEIPEPVEALVLSMLAKDPERRPNMATVAAEIAALAGPAVRTPRDDLRLHRSGLRLARRSSMAFFVLLVVLFEATFYLQHHEFWWPAHERVMVRIPAGTFVMGSSEEEVDSTVEFSKRTGCPDCSRSFYLRELPQHTVQLSAFEMDTSEVTNEQFAAWLNRQKNLQIAWERRVSSSPESGAVLLIDLFPGYGYSGIHHVPQNGHYEARQGMEKKPVAQVTWDAALRYCLDHGKRLPTEAEWEFAARGPKGFRFPWGDNEPRCEGVIFGRAADKSCKDVGSAPGDVGSAAQDRTSLGIHDLGGNVAEWVMDRFVPHYQPCSPVCRDPVINENTSLPIDPGKDVAADRDLRVVRGGAWFRGMEECRAAGRSQRKKYEVSGDIGFRCARSLPP